MSEHFSKQEEADLGAAISLRRAQKASFEELASRFQPFDPKLSHTLEVISVWYGMDFENLAFFYATHPFSNPILDSEAREEHFFVIHEEMASRLLTAAVANEDKALAFLEAAWARAADVKLKATYRHLKAVTLMNCQKLEKMTRKSKGLFSPPVLGKARPMEWAAWNY